MTDETPEAETIAEEAVAATAAYQGVFQVVVQVDPVTVPPNYVAGCGPYPDLWPAETTDADFGDGYHLVNIPDPDDQCHLVIEAFEFCYLSADGLSLYGGDAPA